jgi:heme exporter protein D
MTSRSDLRRIALALALAAAAASAQATARADDALDPLRERFRTGMESYRSGRFADAILVWEAIYRELGPTAGYRLAFNLGRAYDAYGDSTRAAEHYQTYLGEVARRRERGESIEANVEKQEAESRERLEALAATKARIQVPSGDRVVLVQIDNAEPRAAGFVAYVAPGAHRIVFAPGKDEVRREIEVRQGELVEVPVPAPATQPPLPVKPAPAALAPPTTTWETRTERPFSPVVVWVAGGVTVLSLVVPAVTYGSALSIKSDYDDASARDDKERLARDYEDARSAAYVSLVAPAACAAVTAGLFAWWTFGTKESRVPVVPQASMSAAGASLGLTGSF